MTFLGDLRDGVDRLSQFAELDCEVGVLASGAGALSDESVRLAFGAVAELSREVQKLEAVLAGVIAQRSRRENGHDGLAQVGGFRTPVQMVQEITGVSRAEATRVVKVGQALAEGAPALPSEPRRSPWHEPLGAALLSGAVTRAQVDVIRRGLGEPPAIDGRTEDDAGKHPKSHRAIASSAADVSPCSLRSDSRPRHLGEWPGPTAVGGSTRSLHTRSLHYMNPGAHYWGIVMRFHVPGTLTDLATPGTLLSNASHLVCAFSQRGEVMLTKKRGAVAAIVAIVLLGVGVPTAAYADDDETDQLVISFPVDEAFEEELGTATAQNTSTGEMITPFYDPPLGGCDWSDTSGTITANYLSGVLSDLTANYQGKTTCLTTAAGQSMEHMSTVVNLYKNYTNMDSGNVDDCNYNTVNSCTLVLSVGIHNCIGDLLCEGTYQVGQFPTMTLPDGWTWTSWPSSCTNLGTDTLACYSYSGTMVIPLVYPG